jgi:hypothetical protein
VKIKQTLSRAAYSLALAATLVIRLEALGWQAQVPDKPTQPATSEANSPRPEEQPPAISLSPAVVSVKAKPGQSFSQELTLWNNTVQELEFEMEARDVVVRDGKRVFLPAGEVEGSIARYAVFMDKDVVAMPGSSVSTTVTVTVPNAPSPRAIACIFKGKTVMGTRNSLAMTGSLGALFTFTLADDFHVRSQPLQVVVDAEANLINFRQDVTNTGSDPIVPKGAIAVTNESGRLVARLPVSGQRLLPGESQEFTAEHSGLLKTGKYRATVLMENESAFFSNAAEFSIK